MIEAAIAVAVLAATAFTLGYITARRRHMATPDQLKETFRQTMAATKAAFERNKAAAVEIAVAKAVEDTERKYDAVDAEMMEARPGDFSPSGN